MRSNRTMAWRKTPGAFSRGSAALVLAAMLSGGPAVAAPIALVATQTPNPDSFFSLAFPVEYGAPSNSLIAQTDFSLEIDADLATARFTQYDQFVKPLILPGPVSTGNIQVVVQPGTSEGTLNVLTGEFITQEVYDVYFDGDLSAYGFESPVPVPSTSVGTVKLSALTGGEVTMRWEGTYPLPNPYDPSSPINLRYTCSVHSTFAAQPVTLLELALIPKVVNLELPLRLEALLLNNLNEALDHLNSGESELAASALETFINSVEYQRGRRISNADADTLVADAEGAIDLLDQDDGFAHQK